MKVANEGWVGGRVSVLFTFRFTSVCRGFISSPDFKITLLLTLGQSFKLCIDSMNITVYMYY